MSFLYAALGISLCISVPLVSFGPSFAVWPSLSLIALLSLGGLSLYNLALVIGSMDKINGTLMWVIPLYLLIDTCLGLIQFNVPIQYPLWTLSVFFLWIIVIPWLFFEKDNYVMRALAWGIFIGAIINAFSVIADMYGMSPALLLLRQVNLDTSGPWQFLASPDFFKYSGGVGLFSYSRTSTGFLLATVSALCFVLIDRERWRVMVQLIFFTAILYTGSRLGFLSWIFVMLSGYRNAGVQKGVLLLVGFISFFYMGLFFGFFDLDGLQGRLFNLNESYSHALSIRINHQISFMNGHASSLLKYVFGSGPGISGYALGLNKLGFNIYEAHGSIFQYLADVGAIGFILFVVVLIRAMKGCWRYFSLWGILLSFGLSTVVDDLFFPKTQSVFTPVIFAIVFIAMKSNAQRVQGTKDFLCERRC